MVKLTGMWSNIFRVRSDVVKNWSKLIENWSELVENGCKVVEKWFRNSKKDGQNVVIKIVIKRQKLIKTGQ
jgi:hypothetical protein